MAPPPWHGSRLAAVFDAWKAPVPRRRPRLNWLYDNDSQQFTTPSGRVVTLREIAQLLQDHVSCHFDFTGPWSGWRMRGAVLIPPGGTFRGSNITASNALGYRRWLASFEGQQAQLPLGTPQRTTPPTHPADTAGHECIPPAEIPVTLPPSTEAAPELAYAPRRRAEVIVLADRRRARARG